MRSLKELYELLYERFLNNDAKFKFLCNSIHGLYDYDVITVNEFRLLLNNFHKNRPSPKLHKKFCDHELYSRSSWNWFGNGNKANELRIEFAKYLIDNHIV